MSPSAPQKAFGHSLRKDFFLESKYVPVNHGSYGTYPRSVRAVMRDYQDKGEEQPDRWFRLEFAAVVKQNLERIASLLHCDSNDIVYVQNASTAASTVLRSLPFEKGDKILCYSTAYNAIDRANEYVKDSRDAKLIKITLNYPMSDEEIIQLTRETIEKEQAKGDGRFRICVMDALISIPGVLFPYKDVTKLVKSYNMLAMVDGAHAIGQIPLDLTALDADFFFTNGHKWMFMPRGCAVLYVAKRNQGHVHPLSINAKYMHHKDAQDNSSFQNEFGGLSTTIDCANYLCANAALDYRQSLGGEDAIMKYCNDLAVKGGALVAKILGTEVMENKAKTLTVAMVNVRVPVGKTTKSDAELTAYFINELVYKHNTMISVFKHNGLWWARFCAQVYVELEDFEKAAKALLEVCKTIA
ncbi:pyridoxal phosphate-dependent transferase [Phycomyces blakesleeanus]|uniref:Aminotransferase class V domain-containing protein n=2 Tax=Phycomyces blakesleeanus TaxID=4837 RepID=A0A167LFX9_PHYB8|nr:hypothetical protein PHYBLDRAFT_56724 [Phycomyces blakesleeanus NRRL 1555(-)]OAD70367.1 hypothetical protein PHYBLDRAFT_56724 [Phycomyces blakesleeanus NRRL 1555(-)]|eukprot:XP_018288407.1 hypothetical protein PHYBLDRAFT_56724 [Phycomyces blakesleeanus NRRL 1555(-)]